MKYSKDIAKTVVKWKCPIKNHLKFMQGGKPNLQMLKLMFIFGSPHIGIISPDLIGRFLFQIIT